MNAVTTSLSSSLNSSDKAELIKIVKQLGFSTEQMSPEQLQKTISTIITIFQSVYPDSKNREIELEECKKCFEDWPSLLDANSAFPVKIPGDEISLEEQKRRYSIWTTSSLENERSQFLLSTWLPDPSQESLKITDWTLEEIQSHVENGGPIYIRLMHSEDECAMRDNKGTILPSRINQNLDGVYNPHVFHDKFSKYIDVVLPEEIRFEKETEKGIAAIQEKEHVSRYTAFCRYAKTKQNQDEIASIKLVFDHFLLSHESSRTEETPFKGMLGGTIKDRVFIKEMNRVINGYKNAKK